MKKTLSLLKILVGCSLLQACGCTVVDPGNRGIKIHLGEVTNQALPEGLVWHQPLLTQIVQVSVQQSTSEMKSECYSADLQQVNAKLQVLYRIPEDKVVSLYQKYSGDPFRALIAPRVNEALKEATSTQTAEGIVKNREKIKQAALKSAQDKIGDIVVLVDIVIENIDLSKELEAAIEGKMVQQQEASKAEFTKQKAKVEAETALIKAQGEADAIRVRGAAIKENPHLVELQMVEKWDGKAPLVVGAGAGTNILLPVGEKK